MQEHLDASVYRTGTEILIIGIPGEEEEHSCDEMGCSSIEHVLYRFRLPRPRMFHCYHCHTDKPIGEQSQITDAMCWVCEASTNPRLHPELLKDQQPHLFTKYMDELEEYRKEYAQEIGRTIEELDTSQV